MSMLCNVFLDSFLATITRNITVCSLGCKIERNKACLSGMDVLVLLAVERR